MRVFAFNNRTIDYVDSVFYVLLLLVPLINGFMLDYGSLIFNPLKLEYCFMMTSNLVVESFSNR